MIVSVPQVDVQSIEDMQKLLKELPVSHKKRAQIESDLQKMLSGQNGEKSVGYQLEFWFRDAEDVVIANNLRLEFHGRSAQIDHVVAVPAGIMVLESKSFPDQLHIDGDGNWYRVKRASRNAAPEREGMFSPVEQNRRHIAVIQDILEAHHAKPIPKIANIVVLPNPKVVVTGTKPVGATLVRIDRLQALVDRARQATPSDSNSEPRAWIEQLLRYHRPKKYDVYDRYHIDPYETKPLNERVYVDPDTEEYRCAFCHTLMAIQKTKNGPSWGCGKYPQCKNMVPASIVARIGQEFVERYNKEHFWTSRAQRCPNCGGTLMKKRGRYGPYRECVNSSICKYRTMTT